MVRQSDLQIAPLSSSRLWQRAPSIVRSSQRVQPLTRNPNRAPSFSEHPTSAPSSQERAYLPLEQVSATRLPKILQNIPWSSPTGAVPKAFRQVWPSPPNSSTLQQLRKNDSSSTATHFVCTNAFNHRKNHPSTLQSIFCSNSIFKQLSATKPLNRTCHSCSRLFELASTSSAQSSQ